MADDKASGYRWLDDGFNEVDFEQSYPIVLAQVPGAERLNPLLARVIRQVGDEQQRKSNVKADMTNWGMFDDAQPGAEYFRELCNFACQLAMQHSPTQEWYPAVKQCWGALYRKGEHTIDHNHWPALWSFTYYVEATAGCAPLLFPKAGIAVKPRPGQMCLFPGWVNHGVPEQQADAERIMVAGNIVARH